MEIAVRNNKELDKAIREKYSKIVLVGEIKYSIKSKMNTNNVKKKGGAVSMLVGLAFQSNPFTAGIGLAAFWGGAISSISAKNLNKYELYENGDTMYLLKK